MKKIAMLYIPIFIISIGLFIWGTIIESNRITDSSQLLMVLMFSAFFGSVIGEVNRKKISLKDLKVPIALFVLSFVAIGLGAYLKMIFYGCILASLLGVFAFIYIYRKVRS